MKKGQLFSLLFLCAIFSAIIFIGCSKSSGGATTPTDPCAGITVVVTGNSTAATSGASDGSITVSATGGSGFTYSLNGGSYQASGTFSGLAAAKYTMTAKNSNGCIGTLSVTVVAKATGCTGTPGPKFTAVKALITTNCAVTGCHNGTQSPNYTVDCTIVDYADLIKTRAVDQAGTADQMPQPPRAALSQADKDKITAWITAGKRITD